MEHVPLPTSFRSRTPARDGQVKQRTAARRRTEGSPSRHPKPSSIFRPILAGMATAALLLYASGWGLNTPGQQTRSTGTSTTNAGTTTMLKMMETRASSHNAGLPPGSRFRHEQEALGRHQEKKDLPLPGMGNVEATIRPDEATDAGVGAGGGVEGHVPDRLYSGLEAEGSPYFSESDVAAVVDALASYTAFARDTLETDEIATREGRPLQGKYIVLDSGNELVNRLRGVLSGFLLGVVSDRVFVADITYQKDTNVGLLSALFEGPGYQWDLSKLSPQLRRALAPESGSSFRGAGRGKVLRFDMSEDFFQRWVCDDVLGSQMASVPVVTLSTVVYPLPLLVRNPTYASHPLLAASAPSGEGGGGGGGWEGFAGGRQARIEALETLLTRIVLKPSLELRKRARDLAVEVRAGAEKWWRRKGSGGQSPKVVGLHVRTYFVKAVSGDKVVRNLEHFAECASAGSGDGKDAGDIFYFVATDEAETQALARQVWGDGCFFVPFDLPGSKLEGIKAAFVDLLVMGSLDDYVMTPHSSFSELGSSLSHTWLSDSQDSLRMLPNRPIVPLFPQMNNFEQRKVQSLLDRRAAPIPGGGGCMRAHAAGMSVAVAKGTHLISMFEAIEKAPCLKGLAGVADL